MAFQQDLTISMTDCCDTIELCDATCEPNPCNSTTCADGYGVAGNINKWDVKVTEFNITFPDGSIITGLDLGYIPNNRAYAHTEITAGTTGTYDVVIAGYGQLGVVTFDTDLSTTAANLVIAINSNAHISGWSAYIDSSNDQKIWFYNTSGDGALANGAAITVNVTGDMAGTADATTAGGTDEPDCKSITLGEIWALNAGVVFNDNPGPNFADGVYVFDYVTYDAGKVTELGRASKTVLFDCNVVSCLKETLLTGDSCGCDSGFDDRILKTRLKIEQARYQFSEALYDCANDTIIMAGELCTDVCTDC